MLALRKSGVNRWAPSDGGVRFELSDWDLASVTVRGDDGSREVNVTEGWASLPASDVMSICPIGESVLWWGDEPSTIERVGSRYCTRADLEEHGELQEDGFDDREKYPDAMVASAIQTAEEAIEQGTGRSFCERATTVHLPAGHVVWLPVEDAREIEPVTGGLIGAALLSGAQASVPVPGRYRIVYGAPLPAALREACVRLVASRLRPKTRAEDARGSSVDGVYTSYTLATGEDGSWTGLPSVDAAIAANAAHRVAVL